MAATPTPTEVKARELASWTSVAPGWRKYDALMTRLSAPVSERMLDLAGVAAGGRVLDIAAGTGEPALRAAERVGKAGRVLATDFVEEMLAFAREKATARGLTQIELRRVDGETVEAQPGSFDAVTIRWGLMFMPDPLACLRRAHDALRPGGRIAVACWAAPERNPFVGVAMGVLRRHIDLPTPPPGAPGIFAFADGARLQGVLRDAGFVDVQIEVLEVQMTDFDSAPAYWTFLLELAGPIATLYGQLAADKQAVVAREVVTEAEGRMRDGNLALHGTTWIASAQK